MKIALTLAGLFFLSVGLAHAREVGIPLVKPLPEHQSFSPNEYAKALRGEASSVQINCTLEDHAAAYRLLLHDATAGSLPILMENLIVRPFPPNARIRVTGLNAQTCKPFVFERKVHTDEGCLFSTNLGDCVGSAWCGNAAEITTPPAPAPAQRGHVVQYAGTTPWISETGDGLVWGAAFADCHEGNECGQKWGFAKAGLYTVAAIVGAALLPEHRTVQNITTKVTGKMRKNLGGPKPPDPAPPDGGPVPPNPAPPDGNQGPVGPN